MNHNCPICNKAGLPDYTKSEVVCPQCNSDLKAFLLLDSISAPKKGSFRTYALLGLALLTVNDSISTLTSEKLAIENPKEEPQIIESKEVTVKYVVKKGDYPYKISQFFYGDGNKYKQIEAVNDLEQPYTLKVGQILLIKISQD